MKKVKVTKKQRKARSRNAMCHYVIRKGEEHVVGNTVYYRAFYRHGMLPLVRLPGSFRNNRFA